MQVARDLGMISMAHIGDPETWFATKYSDPAVYGTRAQPLRPLRGSAGPIRYNCLDRAHMGGWPDISAFLSGLLERHPNLYLDASATKCMVR